jgi:hypothetical protein
MLSFKENFFFFRFSVLFFILTIFGYWGIDLNSEELYIAFSFFVLVIAVFILVRSGILFFFVKAVNMKYSRILADLLLTVAALRLQISSLSILGDYLVVFLNLANQFLLFLTSFVHSGLPVFAQVYLNKFLLLQATVNVSAAVFIRNCIKSRKSGIFFGKFFDITL